jgi:regulator of protease activity HflC (stomatin/prohibitin superfamily)
LAIAVETRADGERMAEIKKAEGVKTSILLRAEGEASGIVAVAKAKATEIETINTSLRKNFKDEAIIYKKLETFERALKNGTKYVVDPKSNMVNVMSEMAGVPVLPLEKKNDK